MRRALERRLARVEATAFAMSWSDLQKALHRQSLRTIAHCCDLIRGRFRLMGLDPALAEALKRGEEAAVELAAIPNTPELKAADDAIVCSARTKREASDFYQRIEQTAARFREEQRQPDLSNWTIAELMAFCVSIEMDAWAEESIEPTCNIFSQEPNSKTYVA